MGQSVWLVALIVRMVYIKGMGFGLKSALWVVTAVILSMQLGCAGKTVDESDPGALYQDALEDIESDHYQLAIEKLRAVRNKFPYSKYAVEAGLKIGDVYMLQESYAEAAAAYETFRELHPKHERVSYAMLQTAKAYQEDAPDNVARDLTSAYKALDVYNEFLKKFPSAPEADEARKNVKALRDSLAEKELYIGNFYYRENQYEAAQGRYQKVVRLYPETNAANQAKERLKLIDEKSKSNKK